MVVRRGGKRRGGLVGGKDEAGKILLWCGGIEEKRNAEKTFCREC